MKSPSIWPNCLRFSTCLGRFSILVRPSMTAFLPRLGPPFLFTRLRYRCFSSFRPCTEYTKVYIALAETCGSPFSTSLMRPDIISGDQSRDSFASTKVCRSSSLTTFIHWTFEYLRFTYALCPAFLASYVPCTFLFNSSEIAEGLRPRARAMARTPDPPAFNRSILLRSLAHKCSYVPMSAVWVFGFKG